MSIKLCLTLLYTPVSAGKSNGSISNGSITPIQLGSTNSINVSPRRANINNNAIRNESNNGASKSTVVSGSGGTVPVDSGVTPVTPREDNIPHTLDVGMKSSEKRVPPHGDADNQRVSIIREGEGYNYVYISMHKHYSYKCQIQQFWPSKFIRLFLYQKVYH